jgi:cytochrome P450
MFAAVSEPFATENGELTRYFFNFSVQVALRTMAGYYIGNADINNVAPHFIENFVDRGSKSFGFGLVANVLLGPIIGRLAQRPAKTDRSALIDEMEDIIVKVLQNESQLTHSSYREPYLTQFFRHVTEKAKEAGHDEVKIRDLADFAISQIGSGAGGPTTLFTQLVLFLVDSPKRKEYLKTLKDEINAQSGNVSFFQSQSTFLHNCIAETLRLVSHTLGSMRLAIQDWEISNNVVPAGTFVGVSHVASCYDARIFAKPEEFVPERWDILDVGGMEKTGEYTPFSGGFHRCPGHKFGKMLVAMLFSSFSKSVDLDSIAIIGKLSPIAWKQQSLAVRADETGITFEGSM